MLHNFYTLCAHRFANTHNSEMKEGMTSNKPSYKMRRFHAMELGKIHDDDVYKDLMAKLREASAVGSVGLVDMTLCVKMSVCVCVSVCVSGLGWCRCMLLLLQGRGRNIIVRQC